MRPIACLIAWMIYVTAINVYIYTFGDIIKFYSNIIYIVASFLMLLFCIEQVYTGFKSELHKLLLLVCLGSVAMNFLLLINYYLIGINDYKWNFCIFNGVELLTACCLLISGKKRGLFKDANNDW